MFSRGGITALFSSVKTLLNVELRMEAIPLSSLISGADCSGTTLFLTFFFLSYFEEWKTNK